MTDHATPNLPSRSFDVTSRFFGSLGFVESYRSDGWMILRRGGLTSRRLIQRHPHGVVVAPHLRTEVLDEVVAYRDGRHA